MRFELVRSLDYATQMRGALRGGIVYIDEKMAAYRRFAKGSWTTVLAVLYDTISAAGRMTISARSSGQVCRKAEDKDTTAEE